MNHALERTSPKGENEVFIGTCILCGKTGLPSSAVHEFCVNPRNMSEQEVLEASILGTLDPVHIAEALKIVADATKAGVTITNGNVVDLLMDQREHWPAHMCRSIAERIGFSPKLPLSVSQIGTVPVDANRLSEILEAEVPKGIQSSGDKYQGSYDPNAGVPVTDHGLDDMGDF